MKKPISTTFYLVLLFSIDPVPPSLARTRGPRGPQLPGRPWYLYTSTIIVRNSVRYTLLKLHLLPAMLTLLPRRFIVGLVKYNSKPEPNSTSRLGINSKS